MPQLTCLYASCCCCCWIESNTRWVGAEAAGDEEEDGDAAADGNGCGCGEGLGFRPFPDCMPTPPREARAWGPRSPKNPEIGCLRWNQRSSRLGSPEKHAKPAAPPTSATLATTEAVSGPTNAVFRQFCPKIRDLRVQIGGRKWNLGPEYHDLAGKPAIWPGIKNPSMACDGQALTLGRILFLYFFYISFCFFRFRLFIAARCCMDAGLGYAKTMVKKP